MEVHVYNSREIEKEIRSILFGLVHFITTRTDQNLDQNRQLTAPYKYGYDTSLSARILN